MMCVLCKLPTLMKWVCTHFRECTLDYNNLPYVCVQELRRKLTFIVKLCFINYFPLILFVPKSRLFQSHTYHSTVKSIHRNF